MLLELPSTQIPNYESIKTNAKHFLIQMYKMFDNKAEIDETAN